MKWKNLPSETPVFFITAAIKDWRPLFQEEQARRILLGDLDFYRRKYGCKILAYVIMPEHYHLVVLFTKPEDVHPWLRDFQSHTSTELAKWLQRSGQQAPFTSKDGTRHVWKEQARALGITSVRQLKTKINYIRENPVRRQLVSSPSDWPWSSWRSYEEGDDSVLRVDREALASAMCAWSGK